MEIDESNNEIGKETPMDQQDNIFDNLVVNVSELISSTDEEISDYKDSPKHSEDTWDVNLKIDLSLSTSLESDGDGVSFSQTIQTQMERLSISSANTSIPAPNLHAASEEMIGDDIHFGPDLAKIFSDDQVEMLQRTPIPREGEVFEDFTDSEDYLQSLPCAELGEGSKPMVEKGNMDRLSDLPDALIHHIFSFLNIKYVLQTCMLSRRYRYLWSSLPTLRISEGSMDWNFDDSFKALNKYIVFVDRLLLLRDSSSDIQTFKLKWTNVGNFLRDLDFKYEVTRHVATWIMAAVKHNIQELNLTMWLREVIKLPDCLFTCKSLTKLKFSGFSRNLTDFVLPQIPMFFPRLRYLALTGVSLGEENLTSKLFSSCPVLESLLLTGCSIKFAFSSLSLKHFQLDNYCDVFESIDEFDITVKLSAPNLTSLTCKDYMSQDYSLVTADIGMKVSDDYELETPKTISELATEVKELYGARMIKFIRAVSNVTDLTLSSPGFLEVVSGSLDSLGDPYFQLNNLRFLKVETWVSSNCMNAIAYLVRISPNIESICLTIEQKELDTNNPGGDWIVGSQFPCLHFLKFVQIQGIQGCLNELKFLQVLLSKATVLENVTLLCYKRDSADRAAQLMEFKEMLLAFRSTSSSVSISMQL